MSTTEVLVIGAGPFGLSISSYLSGRGVDHVIVGKAMDTYRTKVPVGMVMKSEPYASIIAAPKAGYDVATYCRDNGFYYVDRVGPLTLERFLGYADWFTEKLVPHVRDHTVTEITPTPGGFQVAFADADSITARRVVVATGVMPYSYIPPELSGLPSDLVTHVKEHHDLEPYRGKKVAVVGAGQSALETATLLHEGGADVTVIARTSKIGWPTPNPAHLGPIGHIRRPVTQLCEGWHCRFWYTPTAFRQLPQDMRVAKAKSVLGPAGSWWLKDRFEGKVPVMMGHRVRKAVADGSGVQLLVEGPNQAVLNVDHVVAGTGYRIDLARLPFLPADLRGRIATISGYPSVSRIGESTVPGLYFVGAPTAASIGPSARFIAGTHTVVAKLTKALAGS
jgi:FAD-dependent urate hydroxylase